MTPAASEAWKERLTNLTLNFQVRSPMNPPLASPLHPVSMVTESFSIAVEEDKSSSSHSNTDERHSKSKMVRIKCFSSFSLSCAKLQTAPTYGKRPRAVRSPHCLHSVRYLGFTNTADIVTGGERGRSRVRHKQVTAREDQLYSIH